VSRGNVAAAAATLAAFVALDACLGYLLWGVGFGMHDVEWLPLFPLWLFAGALAVWFVVRLRRAHRAAVSVTTVLCALLSVVYLGLALFFGVWACGDGSGCRGFLAR
jgi:hypothetical protein